MGSFTFRQTLIVHALTAGNGYAEIIRDPGSGRPVSLAILDPDDTEPRVEPDDSVFYHSRSNNFDPIPDRDVVHIAGLGWDGLKGYGVVDLMAQTIGISLAENTYRAALLGNSAAAGGIIEYPAGSDPRGTKKAADRDAHNREHQGPVNAGKIDYLYGGARWVQTSYTPTDAQLIEGCRFSIGEFARILNLPMHKLGLMDGATVGNLGEQNQDFYTSSLLPWIVRIEQEFNEKLIPDYEQPSYFITHDPNQVLMGGPAGRAEQERSDLATGIRSINEVRVGRGLEPLDNPTADKHWVPVNNLQAIEDMGGSPERPASETDPDDAIGADPTSPTYAVDKALESLP